MMARAGTGQVVGIVSKPSLRVAQDVRLFEQVARNRCSEVLCHRARSDKPRMAARTEQRAEG